MKFDLQPGDVTFIGMFVITAIGLMAGVGLMM
jgi:hypothetical protein